jgi:hypothetical protein
MKKIILILFVLASMVSCKREDTTKIKSEIVACDFGVKLNTTYTRSEEYVTARNNAAKPPKAFTITAFATSPYQVLLNWGGTTGTLYTIYRDNVVIHSCTGCSSYYDNSVSGGQTYQYRVNNSNTVTVVTPQSPASGGMNVVLLDFDGHTIDGTSAWAGQWGGGSKTFTASGLTQVEIDTVFNRVQYSMLEHQGLFITMSEQVYNDALAGDRMRDIITPTNDWYQGAAGVSYNPSFGEPSKQASFTFPNALSYNIDFISKVIVHETGHTFGLNHPISGGGANFNYMSNTYVSGAYYGQYFWSHSFQDNTGAIVDQYQVIANKLNQ